MGSLDDVKQKLLKFREERDWEQFHNPKDLALAISIEANELLEVFLWKDPSQAKVEKVREELADILSYCIYMAKHYELDISQIILDKIEQNSLKYPVEKSKGTAAKYTEL